MVLIALLVGLGFLLGPNIASEGKALATSLPSLLSEAGSGQLVLQVGQNTDGSGARQVHIQDLFSRIKTSSSVMARLYAFLCRRPLTHLVAESHPHFSIFFLKDGGSIGENLVAMGRGPEERQTLRGTAGDVMFMLGSPNTRTHSSSCSPWLFIPCAPALCTCA